MSCTLLLNADQRPISMIPLSIISWQSAASRVYLGEVDVLYEYENWIIHSPSIEFKVPAVLALRRQASRRKNLRVGNSVMRPLLFLRDNFTCQYCGGKFPKKRLTIDHVIPRSKGGENTWVNTTTACDSCNWNRGCNTDIRPQSIPFRPTYGQLLNNLRGQHIVIPHESWNYYLGWPQSNVEIGGNGHFDDNSQFDFDALRSV